MRYCDKDIVLYDLMTPLRYVGYKDVRDHMEAVFYSKGPKDINVDFLSLKVLADGNLGVANSIQHFAWKEGGQPRVMTVRQTDVCHKSGGEWKLIQSHISVPIGPKTGQAQTNLSL
jgi:ketosteroid isomerase-like protein